MTRSNFALLTMLGIFLLVCLLSSCATTEYTSSTYRHHNHGACAAYQNP